jgi:hypothetical protein
MAEYKETPNRGAAFPNKKEPGSKIPDFSSRKLVLSPGLVGELYIACQQGKVPMIDISMWAKTSSKGNKYLNISVAKAWEGSGSSTDTMADRSKAMDDDEIPF